MFTARELKALALENTGPAAQRIAAIQGRWIVLHLIRKR
jgi:hypothetical protein